MPGIVDTRCLLRGRLIPHDPANRQSKLSEPLFYQTLFWHCDRYFDCIIITSAIRLPLASGVFTATFCFLTRSDSLGALRTLNSDTAEVDGWEGESSSLLVSLHSTIYYYYIIDNKNTELINRPKAFDNVHVQFLSSTYLINT